MARDFKAALQQRDALQNIDRTVPGFLPDPSTFMQPTPGGKRRARTFSQTIADATRGIEAGAAPSGGKMDSMGAEPSVNMARPDWRGHYDAAQNVPTPRAALQLATYPPGQVGKAASTLYSHRPLLNASELHAWATAVGIPNLVPPHEMHVTTIYSRQPADITPRTDTVIAKRNIAPLGDKGAVVLHFESPELQAQHAQALAAGASHDFPSFLTHVTLSYDTGGQDFSGLEAPKFPLVFGPEVHKPINENWAEEKGLRKGFDPSEARDNDGKWTDGGGGFGSTSPEKFIAARSASDRAAFLSGHTASELADHRLFVSEDHKVGYALDPHGDLQNLFNNGGPKGAGQKALVDAIKHGATTLDAFDPGLPRLYSRYGFVPVARIPFNEEYAPPGWNYERDGKPDVVFMAYRGGDRGSIEQRIGSFPEYQPGSAPLVSDYDAGKAAQRSASVGKGAEPGGPEVPGGSRLPLWGERLRQSLEKHQAGNGTRRQFLGGVFEKYSPDQERDDHGRWSPGGGSSDTTKPGVHARNPNDARDVKAKWIAESPLKNIDQVYRGADENKRALDAGGEQVAAETGAQYKAVGIKGLPRVLVKRIEAMAKMAAGRPAAGVTDIVRASIVTDTPAKADQVVEALGKHFPITDEGWKKTDVGYFDRAVNVRFPNGQIGEVLLAPKELLDAKSPDGGGGHDLYVAWREKPQSDPQYQILGDAQRQLYGAAKARLGPEWAGLIK